ncbi:hypothetical protein [Spiroplasma culicicola]|uniref:GH18 domain-containing protein n=1 Tax=Spiroplasma culicicola AES-1 TaxID=1276246 RepID=W6AHE2_9MOLU|nr:hypothetical protein [Spiroplasma culicicola]AHI53109.1 hypothetical protein SCULI_v1c07680 [Spiroplasma culicicola AES-1]
MKKLLNLMAVLSLSASTTTLTVSCFGNSAKSITSYGFNVKDIVVGEPTQRALILALIEKNADINNLSDKELEMFASITFENFQKQENSNDKWTARMKGAALSNITTGAVTIQFRVDESLLTYETEETKNMLTGFWYGWGNGGTTAQLQNLNSNWAEEATVVGSDRKYEEDYHKYDIINLAYAVAAEYNPAFDLWVNGNENICTLNPESLIAVESEGQWKDTTCKKEYAGQSLLTARESGNQDIKYTASIGGSSADRMIFKWNQKDEVKQSIETNLIERYQLNGIDLNLAGKAIHDKTTKAVFSQVLREIKLEHWIKGEEFLISLTTTFDGLKKSNYDIKGMTYWDLIDSFNGYSDTIAPSTFNIFEGFSFTMLEDIKLKEVVKTGEDTWKREEVAYKRGDKISRTIISQKSGFMYAYMKSLTNSLWSNANGIKYLGDQASLQVNINISGEPGEDETGLFKTNFHYANFIEAFKNLLPEEQEKFIGFSGMFVNDNEFADEEKQGWLYKKYEEAFIDKKWQNSENE